MWPGTTGTWTGDGMAIGDMSVGAAMACAGAAACVMGGRDSGVRRARLLFAGSGAVATGPPGERALAGWRRLRGRLRAEGWALVAGAVIALLGASVLPLFVGAAAVPLLRRVRRAGEARHERER